MDGQCNSQIRTRTLALWVGPRQDSGEITSLKTLGGYRFGSEYESAPAFFGVGAGKSGGPEIFRGRRHISLPCLTKHPYIFIVREC